MAWKGIRKACSRTSTPISGLIWAGRALCREFRWSRCSQVGACCGQHLIWGSAMAVLTSVVKSCKGAWPCSSLLSCFLLAAVRTCHLLPPGFIPYLPLRSTLIYTDRTVEPLRPSPDTFTHSCVDSGLSRETSLQNHPKPMEFLPLQSPIACKSVAF